jgi:hypothetical protein
MLFDLRSRGRRTTVRGIYLGLAILMGSGLILFGVGTGVSGGGLFGAFTGGGSNSNQPVVSQAVKQAQAATKARPSDPQAWSSLVQAYDSAARQELNSSTGQFTAAGRKDLTAETQAFQHYTQLTSHPDPTTPILAARAYAALGDFAGAAQAWEAQAQADPGTYKWYGCLAEAAYAAKQTRKGDLALNKALSLAPKAQQPTLKLTIQQAKTQPQVVANC